MNNPYAPVVEWIEKHAGTGSANGLAKLILSLWHDGCAFGLRECVESFDDTRLAWAEAMTTHFLRFRADRYLDEAGKRVKELCPNFFDQGLARK